MPPLPLIFARRCHLWSLCFILLFGFSSACALDLNQATRAQLRAIKGVGDKLADRILAAREKGRFASMEDLAARVPGVGVAKLRMLRKQGVSASALAGNSVPRPDSAQSYRSNAAHQSLPAMPMLIQPRPRPVAEPARTQAGAAGTGAQDKTH